MDFCYLTQDQMRGYEKGPGRGRRSTQGLRSLGTRACWRNPALWSRLEELQVLIIVIPRLTLNIHLSFSFDHSSSNDPRREDKPVCSFCSPESRCMWTPSQTVDLLDFVPSLAAGSIGIIAIVPFSKLDIDQQFFGEFQTTRAYRHRH